MPTKSKAKKAKPTKPKTAKKSELKKVSTPMKAALNAVAAMPVCKESKLEAVIKLLKRAEGATIEDIVAATGWQQHTIRSTISHALAKKRGYQIVSDKPKGEQRIYKIADDPLKV